jgi:hypothetical protein
MRRPTAPKRLLKMVKKNPSSRGQVYLAMILLAGLLLSMYRNQGRFQSKSGHHHHHRNKGKTEVMNVL